MGVLNLLGKIANPIRMMGNLVVFVELGEEAVILATRFKSNQMPQGEQLTEFIDRLFDVIPPKFITERKKPLWRDALRQVIEAVFAVKALLS